MGKQLLKFLCVLFLFSVKLQAAHISPEQAQGMALSFYVQQMGKEFRSAAQPELQLAYQATSKLRSGNVNACFYVFNVEDGKGFVIISADDRTFPVLGYSDHGSFDYEQMPDAMKGQLSKYTQEIQQISTQPLEPATEVRSEWEALSSRSTRAAVQNKTLNTAPWSQDSPFNVQCPGRKLVGCVGTAMAIIMKYHGYPAQGTGERNNVQFDVPYQWGKMNTESMYYYSSKPTSDEINAVATLMCHAAVSIDTNFGLYASSSTEKRVPVALTTYFGYDRGVEYRSKEYTSDKDWNALIKKEIDENRPVLYAGQDVNAGHAFVCDGYQDFGPGLRFHINWGWGGKADGFYLLSSLNPLSYNFSSLEAIVYNIKPATGVTVSSAVQLTSDEKQVGMTSDTEQAEQNKPFSIWAGSFKNTTYTSFNGNIAVALVGQDQRIKELLSDSTRRLSLESLAYNKALQFACQVKTSTVGDTDLIRLVTKADGDATWQMVSGTISTVDFIRAKGHSIGYFRITIPKVVDGADIKGEDKVIKGRNYSFTVKARDPEAVVGVKANGYRLTADANSQYNLNTVLEDMNIEISVIGSGQIKQNKTVWIEPGELDGALTDAEKETVKKLVIFGSMDSRDFETIKNKMKINHLDISGVAIMLNGSNPANAIPLRALENYSSLQTVVLPETLTKICHNAFYYTSLKEVTLPASVSSYEYNLFLGCGQLKKVTARRNKPEFINWCVFTGTPYDTLVVPAGTKAAYEKAENWKKFKNIVEASLTPELVKYKIYLPDTEGLNLFPLTTQSELNPGEEYKFRLETEAVYADYKLTVFANSTKLQADKEGIYTIPDIRRNTMIHVQMEEPERSGKSSFRITGEGGGVGMITDAANVMPGKPFQVTVNALKVPAQSSYIQVAVALTDSEGRIKEIISPKVKAGPEGQKMLTFNCCVNNSRIIASNLLRVVTFNDGTGWYWDLVDGDESTVNSIPALGNEVVYCGVTMPSTLEKGTIENVTDRVIKGMNYSFRVRPYVSTDKIAVAINGVPAEADAKDQTLFVVSNVKEDLNITISVYDQASLPYKTVTIFAGGLKESLGSEIPVKLRVTGEMDQRDFETLKEKTYRGAVTNLDLSDVKIVAYGNSRANTLPSSAFGDPLSIAALESLILPNSLVEIGATCFYRCYKLQEITIPGQVVQIGASAFNGCLGLKKLTVKWQTIPALSNITNIFSGGPLDIKKVTLAVPKGCSDNYKNKPVWKDFGTIVEFEESYSISLPQMEGLTITACEGFATDHVVANGSFKFKVTPNESFSGKYIEVKSGDTILEKDAEGVYTIDKINSNINVVIVVYYQVSYALKGNIEVIPADGFNPDSVEAGTGFQFVVRSPNTAVTTLKVKANDLDLISADSLYTIPDIRKNQEITIVIKVSEASGDVDAGNLEAIDPADAENIKDLSVSGKMEEKEFDVLKQFTGIESLNLSALELENGVLPAQAFAGMDSLRTVELPEALTTVGDAAFSGCTSLESVVMRAHVNSIGKQVFAGCENLTSVIFLNPDISCDEETFKEANPNCFYLKMETASPGEMVTPVRSSRTIAGKQPVLMNAVSDPVYGYAVKEYTNNINLADGYSFRSPAQITLASGYFITYKRAFAPVARTEKETKWTTLCIPFDVGEITCNGIPLKENELKLYTLAAGGTYVKAAGIKKNVPYLISASGELTFKSVSGAVLEVTPDILEDMTAEIEGHKVIMKSTFIPVAKSKQVYAIHAEGRSFDADSRIVQPFEAYLVNDKEADPGSVPDSYAITIDNSGGSVDVELPETSEIEAFAESGQLVIKGGDKAGTVSVYNLTGHLLHRLKIEPGAVRRIDLPAGVYLVNRKKVVI